MFSSGKDLGQTIGALLIRDPNVKNIIGDLLVA
jgi:hypothetical protein